MDQCYDSVIFPRSLFAFVPIGDLLLWQEIDEYITQAKDKSYETMMRFGKRGLNIAATAAVTAATKVSYTHTYLTHTHTLPNKPYQGFCSLFEGAVGKIEGILFECSLLEMLFRFLDCSRLICGQSGHHFPFIGSYSSSLSITFTLSSQRQRNLVAERKGMFFFGCLFSLQLANLAPF